MMDCYPGRVWVLVAAVLSLATFDLAAASLLLPGALRVSLNFTIHLYKADNRGDVDNMLE